MGNDTAERAQISRKRPNRFASRPATLQRAPRRGADKLRKCGQILRFGGSDPAGAKVCNIGEITVASIGAQRRAIKAADNLKGWQRGQMRHGFPNP